MKTIKYNDKTIKLPFDDADYGLDGDKMVEIKNPFSGEGVALPGFAVAVYDVIKGAELLGKYKEMRKGLNWFAKHFPKEYMVLLD